MGLGDTPVALGLSLLVGMNSVSGLLFSFWIGAVIGIGILARYPKGHRMGIEVPFVPFLAAGYLLAFFTQWNPFLF
jgi:prepilin signal peptidase PulO-like enzyme (type II secretory pathway)